ncbi:Protein pih1d3 [Phytophthora boehmeriae]|uniref:RING-type E3 ubiquitin transferase BRCA1 n=1 Tax=Phytophthora boehmeriae TaxID=109152 RepID=A0A8T1X1S2_9STRA|nr:Protein pih1d3 [Phytophthora boehmeriae]
MSLLSPSRLEALRLIREQLRCTLCGNIFQDPQCLDCKHNFCHDCIILHMRRNHSQCPLCQLPTRPSEVTRNQFLESILAAWNAVEKELECLNGDPLLHATPISVADTDRALYRVAGGVTVEEHASGDKTNTSRGRVANHKWHINTQEIRHELRLEQPYLPQHYGANHASSHAKTSSSDLPDTYGATSTNDNIQVKEEKKTTPVSLDEASAVQVATATDEKEEKSEENDTFLSPPATASSQNGLMATQEVESYLERITKQREALSQWERNRQQNPVNLQEILGGESLKDEDGDLLTQMPLSVSALESPDLLATFQMSSRRQSLHHGEDATEEKEDTEAETRRPAKRRVQLSSPAPLYPRVRTSSPSRKRLRVPSPLNSNRLANGHNKTGARQDGADDDEEDSDFEVPDSQPALMMSDDDHESPSSSEDDNDDSDYEVPDSQPNVEVGYTNSEDEEEEYEMKPAVPVPSTPEKASPQPPDQHCERLRDLFTRGDRNKNRVSDDFRSAITAFQSEEKLRSNDSAKSLAARQLESSGAHRVGSAATAIKGNGVVNSSLSHGLSKPPVHATNGTADSSTNTSRFVFVSSDLTREEAKRVMVACQRFGGKFGQDFDLKRDPVSGTYCTSVTHLITKSAPIVDVEAETNPDELRCKRTAKYMRALAEGTFVMDFSWITASLAAGRWLTEEPFEMIGDIYSDSVGKPREARLRRQQTGRRNHIFSMFCFVLLVSENEFDFQFASVRALVNNFGGTVLQAESFEKLSSKQRARRTPIGVVSKVTSPYDAKAKWQQYQIPIVRITWIFDSVSYLEVLPFDDYYPY